MSNKMSSVAGLFGMELGEVFCIKGGSNYTYYPKTYLKFTESGLKESADRTSWYSARAWMWKGLITGALQAIKLPWKPKYDEEYYIPSIGNAIGYNHLYWKGDALDDRYYNLGLVFKSKEEAVAMTKKFLAVARGGDRGIYK